VDNAIPLPNVTGQILGKFSFFNFLLFFSNTFAAKVVEYCKYHDANPTAKIEDEKEDKRTDDICGWDLNFCKVDQPVLFEMILAANYLDIKELLDLTCKTVANMIKGKTPEEIRKKFNIKNDFSKLFKRYCFY